MAKGVAGKLMPPFAKSAGGMLTDQQIGVVARGMMEKWSRPDLFWKDFAFVSGDVAGRCSKGANRLWHILRAMSWNGG